MMNMEIETLLDYVLDSEEIIDGLSHDGDPWIRYQIENLQWNMKELKDKLKKLESKEIPKNNQKEI